MVDLEMRKLDVLVAALTKAVATAEEAIRHSAYHVADRLNPASRDSPKCKDVRTAALDGIAKIQAAVEEYDYVEALRRQYVARLEEARREIEEPGISV